MNSWRYLPLCYLENFVEDWKKRFANFVIENISRRNSSFNYDLRQTAKVGEPVIQNSETKISFNDLIPSLEILFCLKYKIGIIGLTGMTGYRYAKTSEVHAYSYNDGILVDDGKLKLEVDLSGFNLLFGIELEL